MEELSLPVFITSLGELELLNAVELRLFRKEIQRAEARGARAAFRADVHGGIFARQALLEGVILAAMQLALRWTAKVGARSLDIIHVASAIDLGVDTFHTFDDWPYARQGCWTESPLITRALYRSS
jgi:hypothetical protein